MSARWTRLAEGERPMATANGFTFFPFPDPSWMAGHFHFDITGKGGFLKGNKQLTGERIAFGLR